MTLSININVAKSSLHVDSAEDAAPAKEHHAVGLEQCLRTQGERAGARRDIIRQEEIAEK